MSAPFVDQAQLDTCFFNLESPLELFKCIESRLAVQVNQQTASLRLLLPIAGGENFLDVENEGAYLVRVTDRQSVGWQQDGIVGKGGGGAASPPPKLNVNVWRVAQYFIH